ncbi:hypothetical protein, partial [Nitrosopumilus sp.]|uniref:hypothetical protein n=1 Tax=Nitrosopumilus sp. TaxID=2024843 RepID=UPI00247BAB4E
SVSLTESLSFTDAVDTTKAASVDLTESITFTDAVDTTKSASVDLTESLSFTDAVDTATTIIVSLTESMLFTDAVETQKTASVDLTESITLTDAIDNIQAASVSLTESLSFTDAVNTIHEATLTITESLSLADSATALANLASDEELIENEQTTVKVTTSNKKLVVTSSSAKLKLVELDKVSGTKLDYSRLLSGNNVTITNGWTAKADIDESTTTFDVEVVISNSTKVTGPSGWSGLLEMPTFKEITIPDSETKTYSDITAIEIGLSTTEMTFDKPARIEFLSAGGNSDHEAFFKRAGDTSVTFITTTCDADDLATVTAQLAGSGECKFDDGTDLVIWTTHFTSFGDARGASKGSPGSGSSGISGTSGSSGGGGSTGAGAEASGGSGGFGGILGTPLAINEISYDKCSENMARIIVSSDADVPPTVKVTTAKSGVIFAILAEIQPYEELNKFSTVDRYLYELPISSDESFMYVTATEEVGNSTNTIRASVKLLSCEGTTVIVPLPDDTTPEAEAPARIFDTKIQIGNGTVYNAETESEFLFNDGKDLTVSAIIDSTTSLERVELRSISMGQTDSEYIGIKMDVTPLYVSNSTYVVSATIPSYFSVEPGMSYWLHITDEDGGQTESTHYNIGVKPTRVSDIEIEVDMPTIRPSGSIVQPEFYLFNEDEPSYGIVSLMVDGQVVSKRSQLFGTGQTQIIFNWNVPSSDGYVTYDVQGVVELYDNRITTTLTELATHPKTITVSSSDMPSLEVIQKDGQILADPALVYASNADSSLRFTVTDPSGQCVIGGADECLINESTRGNRGGLESIPYGDQILRLRYSGADNALERFSITSIDPIVGQWSVSLESEDDIVQQAHASEDSVVKIKYRYHSETITLFTQ